MLKLRRSQPGKDAPDVPKRPMQWRRMIGYLGPYKWRLLLAISATLAGAALSLIFPEVIQRVVDSVLNDQNEDLLNQVTIFLVFVFFLRGVTSFVERYNLIWVGEKVVVDLRTELYNHLQKMSLKFFSERRVGELVSRASSDVSVMQSMLVNNVNTLLQQSFIMIGALVVMFVLNWRLSLFILALIPILLVFGFGVGFYLRKISALRQDALANALVVTEEALSGIREVKTFVREPYERGRHDGAINEAFQASIRLALLRSLFGATVAFLGLASLAAILWFGGREVLDGRLSGGELIQFLFYGVTIAAAFAALVSLYTQFAEAVGATKRVFEILDTDPDIQDSLGAVAIDHAEGRIAFKDVTFTYDEKQDVLKNINLDIPAGSIVALVGPSGAGKSTMFNLIPRFYDPSSGTVEIDGLDARKLTTTSLREQIAIVPQETMLFGGTIYENIRYGRLDATREEIEVAAQAANAHDFITELPDGYDTIVGERGVRLSGGQRQRVAIARAILKNPRILLLDEATSSLDNESEHLVQEALGRLMQGRTTVIIAHRLSTVRIADQIAVLEKGELIEAGTHDELLAADGLYAHLYELQFREDEPFLTEAGD